MIARFLFSTEFVWDDRHTIWIADADLLVGQPLWTPAFFERSNTSVADMNIETPAFFYI